MSNDYAVDNFYTGGTDKRGHREEIRCYFPQDVHGLLCAIVANEKTPYRTLGDLPRDAVVHRLKQLDEVLDDAELHQDIKLYCLIEERIRAKAKVEMERSLVASMREAIYDPNLNYALSVEEVSAAFNAIDTPTLKEEMRRLAAEFTATVPARLRSTG